jgi:hemoglobin
MSTMYERVGGHPWFEALVERFYEGVESNPVLRPLYPANLTKPKVNLTEFLVQYWGGPQEYSVKRGHPRLRARHLGFTIGRTERDAWVETMTEAVKAGDLKPEDEKAMLEYFDTAATFLINRKGP